MSTLLGGSLHMRTCCYDLEMIIRCIGVCSNSPPLCMLTKSSIAWTTAGKGSFSAKTRSCCSYTVEAVLLQQKLVLQPSPTAKANRSNLSSLFRRSCQLQARMCKCKCQSYSSLARLPNYPLSTLQRGGRLSP